MSTSDLNQDQNAQINHILDLNLRAQLLRFGITAGSEIRSQCRCGK